MLKLSLEALQIIDAIDRRGSFAKAAQELHRVPSTISYTVARLEEDLDLQVFERHGPRILLTPAGRDPVFINHQQRTESHLVRIVIVAERERVLRLQPAMVGTAAVFAFPDL